MSDGLTPEAAAARADAVLTLATSGSTFRFRYVRQHLAAALLAQDRESRADAFAAGWAAMGRAAIDAVKGIEPQGDWNYGGPEVGSFWESNAEATKSAILAALAALAEKGPSDDSSGSN